MKENNQYICVPKAWLERLKELSENKDLNPYLHGYIDSVDTLIKYGEIKE